ncbi:MAG: CHAT domain-containing tetratricopeptide repeat protein [Pirellulales bacterium]
MAMQQRSLFWILSTSWIAISFIAADLYISLAVGQTRTGSRAFTNTEDAKLPAQRAKLQQLDDIARRANQKLAAGNPREAQPLAQSAVRRSIQQFGKEDPATARYQSLLCNTYIQLCDWRRALRCAEQVHAVARKVYGTQHRSFASTTETVGRIHIELGDFDRAEELLQTALKTTELTEGRRSLLYAKCLNSLAVLNQTREQYDTALKFLQQARETTQEVHGSDHPLVAVCLLNEAACHRQRADYESARQGVARALQIFSESGVRHDEGHIAARTLEGAIALDLADYDRAKKCFEAAEKIAATLDEQHPLRAGALSHLALVYQANGLYSDADKMLDQAARIVKLRLGEGHDHYADVLLNRAHGRKLMGDFASAEALLIEVSDIYKAQLGEHHSHYLTSLNNLGMLYVAQERYREAGEVFESTAKLLAQLPDEQFLLRCTVEHNLGLVKLAAGEFDAARNAFAKAAATIEERVGTQQPNFAMSLHNLALTERQTGNPDRADALFQQAAEIRRNLLGVDHPEYARTLAEWALVKEALGDQETALQLARDSVRTIKRHIDLMAAGQSERQQLAAVQSYRRILDCYLSLPDESTGRVDYVLYDALSDWKGAVTRRQRLVRQLRTAKKNAATANLAAELQRATQQLAAMVWRDKAEPNALQKMQPLIERIERLQQELTSAIGPMDERTASVGLEQIMRVLPRGITLVDLFAFEDVVAGPSAGNQPHRRIDAWVAQYGGRIVRLSLGPAEPIESAARRFRATNANDRQAGAVLRQRVWSRIVPHLGANDILLISPDGDLTAVPWSALPISETGELLIEQHGTALCPVPQLLYELLTNTEPTSEPSLLVVGDVQFGRPTAGADEAHAVGSPSRPGTRTDWLPLPGTVAETEAIQRTFRNSFDNPRITLLVGRNASESELRRLAANHKFLHLATHGFFAAQDVSSASTIRAAAASGWNQNALGAVGLHPDLLSGVVLASANETHDSGDDDGILTALELAELDLRGVSLATLSACETGLGKVAGGEGVLGLQRALHAAGVRSTITGIWRVPDHATQALMGRFYRNLWSKGVSRLEALRDAQLSMLNGQSDKADAIQEANGNRVAVVRGVDAPQPVGGGRGNPYFWAGFVLSGDWR